MRRLFVAVGASALLGLGASAAPGDPAPSPSAVQVLVEKLGSDQFAEREAAAAALEKVGLPAAPALRAAASSENPEVRERAAVLLGKLARAADSTSRLAAKTVKLDYADIPLGTAVNDLKRRTGLNVTLDPDRVENPLRRVTCRTGELPVWEALEAFCAAAGLRETFRTELDVPKSNLARRGYVPPPHPPNADAVPVVLIDGKPEKLAGSRGTAVRVLVLPPNFTGHKVTLGTGEVTLCLDVTPAPGLGWQEVAGYKVTKVIDSAGRAGGGGVERNVLPNYDPAGMVVFARPGMAMRFDSRGEPIYPETMPNPRILSVPLKLGTPAARSIKRLEGAVFGEIQVPSQHLVTVTDPKKNAGAWHNGPGELRFCVLEVREPAGATGTGTIKVQLEYPSQWAVRVRRGGWNPGWPEAPRMPGQGNRVEAFDAAGKPFPLTSSGFTDMSDDGMTSIQTFQLGFRAGHGLPAKIVVVGPKAVTVEVPFALEDVPLP
jgi:hypothetical protein